MRPRSPIFAALARIYEGSQAGKTGAGMNDVQPTFAAVCAELEKATGRVLEGEAYELAMEELDTADGKVLCLEWENKRARTTLLKLRLSPAKEREFYDWIGRESPTARRENWTQLFREAAAWEVPVRWRAEWAQFCARRADNARCWRAMEPFGMAQLARGRRMLEFIARLLAWEGRRLVRYASYELTADSKRLEKWQGSLEQLLAEATCGAVRDFESHGLLPMPRVATLHGPLRVWSGVNLALDAGQLSDPATLSAADVTRASHIETSAPRCLILENKAPFLEIAKLRSGVLLVWSSFPNAASVALLRRLHTAHPALEFFHHGDTDPAGYDILRDLRHQTSIPIHSHHMRHADDVASVPLAAGEQMRLAALLEDPRMTTEHADIGAMLKSGRKGDFEQERHREPPLAEWPFFGPA
ncbi:MAG: hypothetical protein K8R23_12865 [Chthoniobacter sp.]|nr:hypothetical protein [Chthoniobacter sp.]